MSVAQYQLQNQTHTCLLKCWQSHPSTHNGWGIHISSSSCYVLFESCIPMLISTCRLIQLSRSRITIYIFHFLQVINQFCPNCWNFHADMGRLTFLNRLAQTTKHLEHSCLKTTLGQSFLASYEQRCTMQMRLMKPSCRSGSVGKGRDPSHGILWWNACETQNWIHLLMKLKKYYSDSYTFSLL